MGPSQNLTGTKPTLWNCVWGYVKTELWVWRIASLYLSDTMGCRSFQ